MDFKLVTLMVVCFFAVTLTVQGAPTTTPGYDGVSESTIDYGKRWEGGSTTNGYGYDGSTTDGYGSSTSAQDDGSSTNAYDDAGGLSTPNYGGNP